jgi:Putative Actinobacterial Holin-X, holin superfamily III
MIEPPEIPPVARTSWRSALPDFLSAKAALLQMEAHDFGRIAVRKVALIMVAAFTFAVAWLGLMAGLTGWIPVLSHGRLPWYIVAMALGVLHFIVATISVRMVNRPGPEAFPLTKQELKKDQTWLKSLIQKKLD